MITTTAEQRRKLRGRRKKRVRRQLRATDRPLLTVYRSTKHIYALIVDSESGRTLTSVSSRSPAVREGLQSTKDKAAARKVGTEIARLARERQIGRVAFNRNGFLYTGKVKELAEAAREAGLQF